MKKNMKFLLCILTLVFGIEKGNAQKQQDMAIAEFIAAETAFKQHQMKNCLSHLGRAEELIGSSNAKLEALRIKALYKDEQYVAAEKYMKVFFAFPNVNNAPEHQQILNLSIKTREAIEANTKEDNLFHDVENKNTKAAYQDYIKKYPNGRYRQIVNEKSDAIDDQKLFDQLVIKRDIKELANYANNGLSEPNRKEAAQLVQNNQIEVKKLKVQLNQLQAQKSQLNEEIVRAETERIQYRKGIINLSFMVPLNALFYLGTIAFETEEKKRKRYLIGSAAVTTLIAGTTIINMRGLKRVKHTIRSKKSESIVIDTKVKQCETLLNKGM